MSRPGKYVVVYDLADDRERVRVSGVLEGYGFRVQESVFECTLTVAMRDQLQGKLEKLALDSGFVLIYRRNENACQIAIGRRPADPFSDENYAYVVNTATQKKVVSQDLSAKLPAQTRKSGGLEKTGEKSN